MSSRLSSATGDLAPPNEPGHAISVTADLPASVTGDLPPPRASVSATASLRSRTLEFLLVGGATFFLYPLAWLLRKAMGPDASEDAVDFTAYYASFVVNNPHFAVTYLLFYKHVRGRALGPTFGGWQRVRYVVAGFLVPAILAIWAAVGLSKGSSRTMGLYVEAMFFLVGWHYVKQGFGILAVLSARRGVRFSPFERAVLLTHCFAGWAYAWANPASPPREVMEKGIVYLSLVRPVWLDHLTAVVFAASTVAMIGALARKAVRERRLPPLAPLTGYLVSIWLWMVYSSLDRLTMYVLPALHSIQYLYMVHLWRRNEARAHEGPPHFGKPAAVRVGTLAVSALGLAFLLFKVIPSFLDGALVPAPKPGVVLPLGPTPYFAAIFVFVNVHHYFMDHVLWRRDNPETRYLHLPDPK